MQSNFPNFSNHHALRWLFMLLLLGSTCILGLKAQQIATFVRQPEIHDFAATLSFLASDWFEGREVGTRGGDMAADYVASMMVQFGLQPIGKPSVKSTDLTSFDSYFQDFEIIQYSVNKASLLYNDKKVSAGHISPWIKDVDFEVKAGPKGAGGEGALVFVGYGISDDVRAYDDYEGQDAKGKIVVVINGFPGHGDTTSPAWSRIGKKFKEQDPDDEYKATNARRHGALALIIIDASGKFEPGKKQLADRTTPLATTNQESDNDTIYRYGDHALPEDTIESKAPYFKMGSTAGRQLMEGTGIDLAAFENTVAKSCKPASGIIKDKTLKFSIAVNSRRLPVRNVLGMLRGTDTTKSIIIGAHYDHLGRRGNRIYHGSDDNASGTAGMLALAKVQAGCREKPACNLIFASWTAEEEGLLGSSHFTYSI